MFSKTPLPPRSGLSRHLGLLALAVCLPWMAGCGWIKGIAIDNVGSALAQSGTSATSDDDPELIEAAFPYQLKLQEGLLDMRPHNKELLLGTCRLATQYGYAYYQGKAEMLGQDHHDEVVLLRDKALAMYQRGIRYCLRAADERIERVSIDLKGKPEAMARAVKKFNKKKDVELLYWTAASWGAAISLGRDKPDIFIDFPVVRALAAQALSLDADWNKGALHEMMITLDGLPAFMGGSPEKAREHFKRAVELQKGLSPGPFVSLALNVSQPAQDKEEFTKLLNQAIEIDPEKDKDNRLITKLMQRKAKALLEHIDELFAGKSAHN